MISSVDVSIVLNYSHSMLLMIINSLICILIHYLLDDIGMELHKHDHEENYEFGNNTYPDIS